MKICFTITSVALFVFASCQRSGTDSSQLDSLRSDSIPVPDSRVTPVQSTPPPVYYSPPVFTFRESRLFEDSVTSESGDAVPVLMPVEILSQTKTLSEECGSYLYKVQLPDGRTGWIDGANLAFPSETFLASTPVTLYGSNYSIFSSTQGSEVTGQECASAWMVLAFSHLENRIYPVSITDPSLTEGELMGLRMRSGVATLEFYSDMAFPAIVDVQVNNNLIELALQISYMDNRFSLYRLFLKKSEGMFNLIQHTLEASPDQDAGN